MAAKKKTEEAPAEAPALVWVEVINQSIIENGVVHHGGARFETTPERADALRHFVKLITD